MSLLTPVRRAVTAMVVLTMVSVALFAQGLVAPHAAAADVTHGGAVSASQGLSTAEHDNATARAGGAQTSTTCLHDEACAGGGALNLGDHTLGVVPDTVGAPVLGASTLTVGHQSDLPAAPTLADPTRPPRLP